MGRLSKVVNHNLSQLHNFNTIRVSLTVYDLIDNSRILNQGLGSV